MDTYRKKIKREKARKKGIMIERDSGKIRERKLEYDRERSKRQRQSRPQPNFVNVLVDFKKSRSHKPIKI